MGGIFRILQFRKNILMQAFVNPSVPMEPLTESINLLDKWDVVNEETVMKHVKFLRLYGQD